MKKKNGNPQFPLCEQFLLRMLKLFLTLIVPQSIIPYNCSCCSTCINKRKPRFNIMFGKFWFGGDFFVPVAFTKEVFFFSGQIGTLSFFFKSVLIFYLFHQTKYGNNMKIEPQHERLPRKFPQRIRPGPRLWQLPYSLTFIWKYLFLNKRKIDFFGFWRQEVT